MWKFFFINLRGAVLLFVLLTLITGIAYPFLITGLSQLFFSSQANGSLLTQNGQIVGSRLIGQPFFSNDYFWGRFSATTPFPDNALASNGSNWGPTNPDFLKTVAERVKLMQKSDPSHQTNIPVDLVTASASGLDPDISPLAAYYQIPRVAKARGLSPEQLKQLIDQHTQARIGGLLGEARVNILELNLALDQLKK